MTARLAKLNETLDAELLPRLAAAAALAVILTLWAMAMLPCALWVGACRLTWPDPDSIGPMNFPQGPLHGQ